jgi:hypothetical protein
MTWLSKFTQEAFPGKVPDTYPLWSTLAIQQLCSCSPSASWREEIPHFDRNLLLTELQ